MFWRLKRETIHTQIEFFFFFFAKVSHSSNSKASCFQGEPAAAAARWFPHTVQQTTHAKTGGELVMKSCWWLTLGLIKITAVSKFQQGRPFPDSDNIFLPDPTPSTSPRFPSRVSQPTNQVFLIENPQCDSPPSRPRRCGAMVNSALESFQCGSGEGINKLNAWEIKSDEMLDIWSKLLKIIDLVQENML